MRLRSLLLFCLFSIAAGLCAQSPEAPAGDQAKDRARKLDRISAGQVPMPAGKPDPMAPEPVTNVDAATQQKYQEAMREYYLYRIDGLRHRRRVFVWQLVSSKIIFVTVLTLVLAGIYFAAVQFHTGLGRRKSETTEIVANLEGIKVSSPVLGVIILVISLAFFYCYLVFVYPITDIF
jgi:hypothetical protein